MVVHRVLSTQVGVPHETLRKVQGFNIRPLRNTWSTSQSKQRPVGSLLTVVYQCDCSNFRFLLTQDDWCSRHFLPPSSPMPVTNCFPISFLNRRLFQYWLVLLQVRYINLQKNLYFYILINSPSMYIVHTLKTNFIKHNFGAPIYLYKKKIISTCDKKSCKIHLLSNFFYFARFPSFTPENIIINFTKINHSVIFNLSCLCLT